MSRLIILDAGPLAMAAHPRRNPEVRAWLHGLLLAGHDVAVAEIADYEVRRELLRAGQAAGIERLNELKALLTYLPLTTVIMLRAAEFWAESRNRGQPTSTDLALVADVILVATAREQAGEVVVATANARHLRAFVEARAWDEID